MKTEKDLEILDEAIDVHLSAAKSLGTFAEGLPKAKRVELDGVVEKLLRLSTLHGVLAGRLSERIKEADKVKRN